MLLKKIKSSWLAFPPQSALQEFMILFLVLLGLFFGLGNHTRLLATPDEARYVEIPREMVATGDYITPRLNGVKYFEKPPLFYWLQALSIKLFGLKEWAMRLWPLLFAILGCLATYGLGRSVYGRQTGIAASLILATSPLYYSLAHLIILDMAFSSSLTLALYAFLMAIQHPPGKARHLWYWGFTAAGAMAFLIKGIAALAIAGPVIVIWALWTRKWRHLWPAYIFSSLFIFLCLTLPWHMEVSFQNPEFLYKYFIEEHFLRYTTMKHMRYQPLWFFIPVFIIGLFPWMIALPTAFKEGLKGSLVSKFLLVWVVWVFTFFSVSNSKLIPYILPCFPPISLLIGHVVVQTWQKYTKATEQQFIHYFSGSTVLLALCIAYFIQKPDLIAHKTALYSYAYGAMVFLPLSGLAVYFLHKIKGIRPALVGIGLCAVGVIILLNQAAPHLQRSSIKPLADLILQHKQPEDKVISYRTYYQDLPVYLQQTIMVADASGELEFGMSMEDTSRWMISQQALVELWHTSPERLFIVCRHTELDNILDRYPLLPSHLVAEDHGNVLVSNQPIKEIVP